MHRNAAVVFVVASALMVSALRVSVRVQSEAPLADTIISHVGVVVPDIDAAARKYAELFGLDPISIRTAPVDLPDGSKAVLKMANVPLTNFHIELIEPVTKAGPLYVHLQKFGPSVHHFGTVLAGGPGSVDETRAALEKKGGRWTLGAKGGSYAYVDFRDRLGATIEIQRTANGTSGVAPVQPVETGLFGGRPLSHFGLAVTDIDATITAFVDILGVPPAKAARFPNPPAPFGFPPGMWNHDAYVMTTMLRKGKIGIELIQSVGSPTPWTETIRINKGDSAIQHVAVGRGTISREDWLRIGQEKGGKWTNGAPPPGGTFAYLDFASTLGLVFE
jgi:catechol 2,3-dioxygenase-like lactoylglutathione lyase family enzyme